MKLLYSIVVVFVYITRPTFGQLQNGQPLALLQASGDDPKTPLIVLSNPIAKPAFGEAIKSEQDIETTLTPDASTTVPALTSSEKPTKKTRLPQKQKPAFNHGQKHKLSMQDFLLMPGMWESSPINFPHRPMDAVAAQPAFYPVPVYIPYPYPFMINQQMHLMGRPSKDKVEDQLAMGFNEMMSQNLLTSSIQLDNGCKWQQISKNQIQPANQSGQKKWRGKWRKTTTTTTTSTTGAPVTAITEPTRLLINSSSQGDSEVKSIEANANNETTETAIQ
ncbi:uncharacterized protein LOC128252477 [Drosophila gunungcola]|uniref:uncharacterized protein LOC128252477 n=1 Tax=Drosophila gunungcola TaxID=103775 RepID=UPI0022E12EC1|nr:uncharacterized protein LOC128252477 [Drosophila gunungcola]